MLGARRESVKTVARISGFLGVGILVVRHDEVTTDYEKCNNIKPG